MNQKSEIDRLFVNIEEIRKELENVGASFLRRPFASVATYELQGGDDIIKTEMRCSRGGYTSTLKLVSTYEISDNLLRFIEKAKEVVHTMNIDFLCSAELDSEAFCVALEYRENSREVNSKQLKERILSDLKRGKKKVKEIRKKMERDEEI